MGVTPLSSAHCCSTYRGIVDCALDNLSVFWHVQCFLWECRHIFDFVTHEAWCKGAMGGISSAGWGRKRKRT